MSDRVLRGAELVELLRLTGARDPSELAGRIDLEILRLAQLGDEDAAFAVWVVVGSGDARSEWLRRARVVLGVGAAGLIERFAGAGDALVWASPASQASRQLAVVRPDLATHVLRRPPTPAIWLVVLSDALGLEGCSAVIYDYSPDARVTGRREAP